MASVLVGCGPFASFVMLGYFKQLKSLGMQLVSSELT